jgi:hypothetical protein
VACHWVATAAIAEGGEVTPEELREALAENAERMKALGIGG